MKVLVTGGAGYIGSVMVRVLRQEGYQPIIFDNLSTGHRAYIPKGVPFYKGDLRQSADLEKFFKKYSVDSVMHFAASCLVGESVEHPGKYYENNVLGSINLLNALQKNNVRDFIFSSSCAVYGQPRRVPITENTPKHPTNPYGHSKSMVEEILKDLAAKNKMRFMALRYFNASGAHKTGDVGERHNPETHLIPNVLKVLTGENRQLSIFGDDYDTPDGTCIRDYVHVTDIARAHLLALKAFKRGIRNEFINLGHGRGHSVQEIVSAVEKEAGRKVRVKICPRRPGDPARLIANPAKAHRLLGWKPEIFLPEIISSAWKWENK